MRRTKKAAMDTRSSLLDAAEKVFYDKGVAAATLDDIANVAGTSRGAIYWHFRGKTDLFSAMMDRVTLPMESVFEASWLAVKRNEAASLEQLLEMVVYVFECVEKDDTVRRVFEIAMFKVEYVGVMDAVRTRHIAACESFKGRLEQHLEALFCQGGGAKDARICEGAIALHALIDGLIQNWILTGGAFPLRQTGSAAARSLLDGLLKPGVQDRRLIT